MGGGKCDEIWKSYRGLWSRTRFLSLPFCPIEISTTLCSVTVFVLSFMWNPCVLIYWTLLTLEEGLLVGIIAIYSCSSRQRLFTHNKETFWKEIIHWKSWETQVEILWKSFNFNLRSISRGTDNRAELTLMGSFKGTDLEEPAPILLDSL